MSDSTRDAVWSISSISNRGRISIPDSLSSFSDSSVQTCFIVELELSLRSLDSGSLDFDFAEVGFTVS